MPDLKHSPQTDVPLHVRRAQAAAKAAELRQQWKAERRLALQATIQQNKSTRATAQM